MLLIQYHRLIGMLVIVNVWYQSSLAYSNFKVLYRFDFINVLFWRLHTPSSVNLHNVKIYRRKYKVFELPRTIFVGSNSTFVSTNFYLKLWKFSTITTIICTSDVEILCLKIQKVFIEKM